MAALPPMRQWALTNVRHRKVKGFAAALPSFCFHSAESSLSETSSTSKGSRYSQNHVVNEKGDFYLYFFC